MSDPIIAALGVVRVGLMFIALCWVALIITGLAIRLLRVSTAQAVADRVTPTPVRRMMDDILVH